MKSLLVLLAALCTAAFITPAEARHGHRHYHVAHSYAADPGCNIIFPCEGVARPVRGERAVRAMGGLGVAIPRYTPRHVAHLERRHRTREVSNFGAPSPIRQTLERVATAIVSHPSGCPYRAFCGCGTAVHLLGAPVRSLWLASNWSRFPRTAPAPGMAAYRNHHVFAIERVLGNGMVVAYDPNSGGHATRIHVRSLRGYTVVNPHGARYAGA